MEEYDFSHYCDMCARYLSYSGWYYSFNPCTIAPDEPYDTDSHVFGVVSNMLKAVIKDRIEGKCLSYYCMYLGHVECHPDPGHRVTWCSQFFW